MDPTLILVALIPVIMIIAMAIYYKLTAKAAAQQTSTWDAAAKRHGLTFHPHGPSPASLAEERQANSTTDLISALFTVGLPLGGSMFDDIEREIEGQIPSGRLSIRTHMTPNNAQKRLTRAQIRFSEELIPPMSVTMKSFLNLEGLIKGGTEAPTGDERFDKHFDVRAADALDATKTLTPTVRQALLNLRRHANAIELNANGLFVRLDRSKVTDSQLENLITGLQNVPKALMGHNASVQEALAMGNNTLTSNPITSKTDQEPSGHYTLPSFDTETQTETDPQEAQEVSQAHVVTQKR